MILLYSLTGLVVLPTILFYIRYAHEAWFFQDDFLFIFEYGQSLALHQLFDFSNFGRFVTRNLYWHVGWQVFHHQSIGFFLFNFVTIFATSLLIFFSAKQIVVYKSASIAIAVIYLVQAPTINAYVWLSNSQHLIGHFFVFLFTALCIKFFLSATPTFKHTLILIFILILGLYSNIFVGLSLSLVAILLLTRPNLRSVAPGWALLAVGGGVFLFFIKSISADAQGAYGTNIAAPIFFLNGNFYFGPLFLPWLTACILGVIFGIIKRAYFMAWLFAASLLFYLPFAFLAHQRYSQYIALTSLFFWFGLIAILSNYILKSPLIRGVGLLAILAIITFNNLATIRYFNQNPWGKNQLELVTQLMAYDTKYGTNVQNYCFKAKPPASNTSTYSAWDIPADWWFVGFGKAFSTFISPQKSYSLHNLTEPCDAVFYINEGKLSLVKRFK